jgi:uncharacterized protein YodC (DUF2158 family)
MNFALYGTPMPEKKKDTIEKSIIQNMENPTSNPLAIGTVVYLKSGSPAMTISKDGAQHPESRIECMWFIESRLNRDYFTTATLTTTNPGGDF